VIIKTKEWMRTQIEMRNMLQVYMHAQVCKQRGREREREESREKPNMGTRAFFLRQADMETQVCSSHAHVLSHSAVFGVGLVCRCAVSPWVDKT
jgi:hypothetical protein